MSRLRREGKETFQRLRDWDRGKATAERLAGLILREEGFSSVDPSHPLGGPDGLKDMICERDRLKWVGAAYFPRGQKQIRAIRNKFRDDIKGVAKNSAQGFVFITNQELTLSERDVLKKESKDAQIEILHLERINNILNTPRCYGVRLEYLDIEMSKEEQLAFIAARDETIGKLQSTLDEIVISLRNSDLLNGLSTDQINENIPLEKIREFKSILDSITGYQSIGLSSGLFSTSLFGESTDSNIRGLRVPLDDLREFARLLDQIGGHSGLSLTRPTTSSLDMLFSAAGLITNPGTSLKEVEDTIDRINSKLKQLPGAKAASADALGNIGTITLFSNSEGPRNLSDIEKHVDRILEKYQEISSSFDNLVDDNSSGLGVISPASLSIPSVAGISGSSQLPPHSELLRYEETLDRILSKLKEKRDLE